MAWGTRILGGVLVSIGSLLAVSGCMSNRAVGAGATGPGGLLALDPEPDGPPRLARAQLAEPAPLTPRANAPALAPVVLPPAQPGTLPVGSSPTLPGAGPLGIQQAAALIQNSEVRVRVRAWVNGRPIFEDELMQVIGPSLREVGKLQEPQRTEKLNEMVVSALDGLIDQEVLYQDAVKRLEKGNPKALEKLKQMVSQDYDKSVKRMRDGGVPDEQIKMFEHTTRRMLERNMISTEYARNHITGYIQEQVTIEAIQAYYEAHKNEFQTVDKVHWQDVFIAVGPKHPTLADARRFAEGLCAKCRTVEDFAKLLSYDDGDSKFRNGEGFGQRRGEIRPPELEPLLFQMKDGQIGPVVELPTGVHMFCLTKREAAGQLPLNDQTQKAIRRKLESQIAEREFKQLVRALRSRSVIRLIGEGL